jgi:hypothetical protein
MTLPADAQQSQPYCCLSVNPAEKFHQIHSQLLYLDISVQPEAADSPGVQPTFEEEVLHGGEHKIPKIISLNQG